MRPFHRSVAASLLSAAFPLLQLGAQGPAEPRRLRVTDTDGAPVAGAEALLRDSVVRRGLGRSDADGVLVVTVPEGIAGVVEVRRVGFKPWSLPLSALAVPVHEVVLEPIAARLDSVLAVADAEGAGGRLDEFRAHRARARFGTFFAPEDIEARRPARLSDLMRYVPGARLYPAATGSIVRIRGCRPLLWIDGVRLVGAEVDEWVGIEDVAAVEVYNSYAGIPPQYVDRQTNCGAIVVWMK